MRKILFIGIWLLIGSGMLVLLIAAIGKQKKDTCKDYVITIKGIEENGKRFMEKNDVVKLLKASTKGNIKGQSKKAFDLVKMEQLLEDNMWVKEARLYFDNQEVLHVSVTERMPVARIFTSGGRSFYLDEEGKFMQLSDKVSARLPVFTGFPEKKKLGTSDSVLMNDIITTAQFISQDHFWNAQVAQLDISNCGPACWEFEMIPLVGNHVVRIGDGKNIEQKFDRLFVFYKEVLSKTGFDKYKTVDVRYEGQVVAGKSINPKVDAAELRKSVEKLLEQIKEAEKQTEKEAAAAVLNKEPAKPATQPLNMGMTDEELQEEVIKPAAPKAVMPKRTGQ